MDCRYLFRTSNPTKARSPYMYIITTNYNKCHTIGQYSTAIGPGPTAQGRLCKVANLYWYAEHLALTISKKKSRLKPYHPEIVVSVLLKKAMDFLTLSRRHGFCCQCIEHFCAPAFLGTEIETDTQVL